jgi:quinol monooxygenase YgiN
VSAAGPIYVVTHVDVIPPRKEDGVALLRQLAADSGNDAGNVRFDVLQQTNRPNHFTVVEAWKDRNVFDAHGMACTRAIRDSADGGAHDERLYSGAGLARTLRFRASPDHLARCPRWRSAGIDSAVSGALKITKVAVDVLRVPSIIPTWRAGERSMRTGTSWRASRFPMRSKAPAAHRAIRAPT